MDSHTPSTAIPCATVPARAPCKVCSGSGALRGDAIGPDGRSFDATGNCFNCKGRGWVEVCVAPDEPGCAGLCCEDALASVEKVAAVLNAANPVLQDCFGDKDDTVRRDHGCQCHSPLGLTHCPVHDEDEHSAPEGGLVSCTNLEAATHSAPAPFFVADVCREGRNIFGCPTGCTGCNFCAPEGGTNARPELAESKDGYPEYLAELRKRTKAVEMFCTNPPVPVPGTVCEHDQLKRQCPTCEAKQEAAEAEAQGQATFRELVAAQRRIKHLEHTVLVLAQELVARGGG